MAGKFSHVSPGQNLNIRADQWNALLDMLAAYQSGAMLRAATISSGSGESGQVVQVLNVNASPWYTLRQFDPVYIAEPLIIPTASERTFADRRVFTGGPNVNSTGQYTYGVALEPIAPGAVGRVQISGVCPMRLYTGDTPYGATSFDDDWERAKPYATGGCTVDRNGPFKLLWKEDWDGEAAEVWGVVQILNRRGLAVVRTTATPGTEVGDYVADVVDLRFDVADFIVDTLDSNTDSTGETYGAIISLRDGLGTGTGSGAIFGSRFETTTTNGTQTTLGSYTLSDNAAYMIEASMSARQTGGAIPVGGAAAVYVRRAGVYRDGGGVATLIGAVEASFDREITAAWDATIDVSGNDVRLRVTGNVGDTIDWAGILRVTQIS